MTDKIRLNRQWNIRTAPEVEPETRLVSGAPGTELELIEEVEGEAYSGSRRWFKAAVYVHAQGADVVRAPEPPGDVPVAEGFDPPVGTEAERAGEAVPPGAWFDANPFLNSWDGAFHTGSDLNLNEPHYDADRGKPVYAVGAGVVTHAGLVYNRWGQPNQAWREIVVIRHPLPDGRDVYSRYAHLDNLRVEVGERVRRGQQIANIGRPFEESAYPGRFHLHLDISPTEILLNDPGNWPGGSYRALQFIKENYVDPLDFIRQNRPSDESRIDLLPYFRGDGRVYRVAHPSGATEIFHTVRQENGVFLQVKNHQWEEMRVARVSAEPGPAYIWRGLDTSPGPAPQEAERPGEPRFYRQWEAGHAFARWCPRYMRPREKWFGDGHQVQFWYKSDCAPSAANSGRATNRTMLVAHHEAVEFNGLVLEDVIQIGGVHADGTPAGDESEGFYFARGFGMVAWRAPWGESAITEILPTSAALQPERLPCDV